MGDRVLFQVVSKHDPKQFSPVIYCHWSGSYAPQIVRSLAERMQGRKGDVEYAAARLVQICTADDDGNLGFGIWNVDSKLTEADSHGDGGVVLIDCGDFTCECLGGYLRTGDDGFPTE
jgi:hypothetical protein